MELFTWFPELRLIAPTAPVPLLERCVREAARAFCAQTHVWQLWTAPKNILPNHGSFNVTFPPNAELLRIQRATLDGKPLPVARVLDMAADPNVHAEQGSPALVKLGNNFFKLYTSPGGQLQIQVSLTPKLTAIYLPDVLTERWFEAITDGAKAKLLGMTGMDWINPQQAAYAQARFDDMVAAAISYVWRSGVAGGKRSKTQWL